jgi:hypothetical protein
LIKYWTFNEFIAFVFMFLILIWFLCHFRVGLQWNWQPWYVTKYRLSLLLWNHANNQLSKYQTKFSTAKGSCCYLIVFELFRSTGVQHGYNLHENIERLESQIIQSFGSNKSGGPKQDSQIRIMSPIPEGGEP